MNFWDIGTLTAPAKTVTTGAVAVTALAANAGRKYLAIHNPLTQAQQFASGGALESIWVNFNGTATIGGTNSFELPPGAWFIMDGGFVTSQAVSVVAVTSLHLFFAYESV